MKIKSVVKFLRFTLISSGFLLVFNTITSQNLIPNPSFEEFIDFEKSNSQGWHAVQKTDSPDYFNLSTTEPYNNLFNEFMGGTEPKSGNGFVGIFCIRVDPNRDIKNIREFIEVPLINGLEKDSLYKVGLSICLDNESNIAVKNFGVFFSSNTNQLNNDFKTLKLKPQIEFNSTLLDNTNSWVELQASYTAKGSEKFLTLGNFMTDKLTITKKRISISEKGKQKKWGLTKKELAAYYYIDDVIIEKIQLATDSSSFEIIDGPIAKEQFFDIDEIKIDSLIVLKNIVFEFNKSDLLPESFNEIEKLYQLLVTNPEIRVKLEGHTDNVGEYDFNLELSMKRVESVTAYLISKGINSERIEFEGYSYSVPLESNDSEEGRAINRRVAFKIIQK